MATNNIPRNYGKPGSTVIGVERAQIIAWIKQGKPRNEVARLAGRAASTISGIAKTEGLTFDRGSIAAAADARQADNAHRLSKINERLIGRVEHLLDRLEAETFTTVLKASFGEEKPKTLKFVPPTDERNMHDTISRSVASIARIKTLTGDENLDDAKSVLEALGRHLGVGG